MKLIVLYLLSITANAGLFGDSYLKEPIDRKKISLCKDNKPNHNYSLTIFAFNDVEKGIQLNQATQKLKDLAEVYDWVAQDLIPKMLIKIEGFKITPSGSGPGSKDYYYLEENRNYSVVNELVEPRLSLGNSNLHHKLFFIPTSLKGDELVVCPGILCEGIVVPLINKTIERHRPNVSFSEYDVYTVKENPFDEIENLKRYQGFNNLENKYFLYDLLSKSGVSIGETLAQSYFVIPEIEQKKLCKEVSEKISKYSKDDCFKYDPNDRSRFKALTQGAPFAEPAVQYMDLVARDYIEKTLFSVEKKNEGSWSIYKIKLNSEFLCKYGRPKDELTTK